MLIKQVCRKNMISVTISILKVLVLGMNHIFAMSVMIKCKKATNFNDVAIVAVKGSAYRIHFRYMSKDDAINIMNGSNLVDKMCINVVDNHNMSEGKNKG